jgi:hypothetical protein
MNAQRTVDIMLDRLSPMGLNKDKYGKYLKANALLNHSEEVLNYLQNKFKDQYSEKDIKIACMAAERDFRELHFKEDPKLDENGKPMKQDLTNLLKVNYRPDINNIGEEGKAFMAMQKLMESNELSDPALRRVVNNNIHKWKQMEKFINSKKITQKAYETDKKTWNLRDVTCEEDFPNYDPKLEENMPKITEKMNALAQEKLQRKLEKDLAKNNSKKKVSPPVEKAPEIKAPEIEAK